MRTRLDWLVLLGTSLLVLGCSPDAIDNSGDTTEVTALEHISLHNAYFAMRDAKICARLDPRTEESEFAREVARTEELLQLANAEGLGDAISEAEQAWKIEDAARDYACPFQLDAGPQPSIDIYIAANDTLEAAIAAEAD